MDTTDLSALADLSNISKLLKQLAMVVARSYTALKQGVNEIALVYLE